MFSSFLLNKKMRGAWCLLGLFSVAGLGFFSVQPALAQSSRDVVNRLSRLENEIETLNRAVYRGERGAVTASSGGDVSSLSPAERAGFEVRLQQLEVEVQGLRGTLEEQSHAIGQLQDKLETSLNDIEMRLGNVRPSVGTSSSSGQYYNATPVTKQEAQPSQDDAFKWSSNASSSSTSQTLGTTTSSSAPPTTSDAASTAYEHAFALLKSSKYEAAGRDFESFLSMYPDHELSGNAKYWLGETYYVRGNYEKAARVFAEGYQKYPKGTKAADNLLKLGMSLAALGNTKDACVALGQLKKDFPSGSGPVLRRADQEMTRLNCAQ